MTRITLGFQDCPLPAQGLITLAFSRTGTGIGNGMGCMVLCRTFHTAPEKGKCRHLLSSIVLVLIPVPVPVPDTASVIAPSLLKVLITGFKIQIMKKNTSKIPVGKSCLIFLYFNWGSCVPNLISPDWEARYLLARRSHSKSSLLLWTYKYLYEHIFIAAESLWCYIVTQIQTLIEWLNTSYLYNAQNVQWV